MQGIGSVYGLGEGVQKREGLIKPAAGKYRRTTFIFSVLIIQLDSTRVRLFLPLSQIEARVEMRASARAPANPVHPVASRRQKIARASERGGAPTESGGRD